MKCVREPGVDYRVSSRNFCLGGKLRWGGRGGGGNIHLYLALLCGECGWNNLASCVVLGCHFELYGVEGKLSHLRGKLPLI